MPATLRLTREGFGIELRRGVFTIVVDGQRVGSIEWQKTTDTPVEPGHHTLQIKAGRYTSREHSFDATDGEVVSFRCHGANLWPVWLVSFAVPSLAISLSHQ